MTRKEAVEKIIGNWCVCRAIGQEEFKETDTEMVLALLALGVEPKDIGGHFLKQAGVDV